MIFVLFERLAIGTPGIFMALENDSVPFFGTRVAIFKAVDYFSNDFAPIMSLRLEAAKQKHQPGMYTCQIGQTRSYNPPTE